MKQGLGLIHVCTGDGKGKTTAAVGMSIRAKGAGYSALFAQLFKSNSSEISLLEKTGIKVMQHSPPHPFFKKYTADELKSEAKKCFLFMKQAFETAKKEKFDILIIDELGPALAFKLVDVDDLISLIKSKPEHTELVLTGRGIPDKIIKLADYTTEMRMIKHPFNKGMAARKGVEY